MLKIHSICKNYITYYINVLKINIFNENLGIHKFVINMNTDLIYNTTHDWNIL